MALDLDVVGIDAFKGRLEDVVGFLVERRAHSAAPSEPSTPTTIVAMGRIFAARSANFIGEDADVLCGGTTDVLRS